MHDSHFGEVSDIEAFSRRHHIPPKMKHHSVGQGGKEAKQLDSDTAAAFCCFFLWMGAKTGGLLSEKNGCGKEAVTLCSNVDFISVKRVFRWLTWLSVWSSGRFIRSCVLKNDLALAFVVGAASWSGVILDSVVEA